MRSLAPLSSVRMQDSKYAEHVFVVRAERYGDENGEAHARGTPLQFVSTLAGHINGHSSMLGKSEANWSNSGVMNAELGALLCRKSFGERRIEVSGQLVLQHDQPHRRAFERERQLECGLEIERAKHRVLPSRL
jgi:hypothetical protein